MKSFTQDNLDLLEDATDLLEDMGESHAAKVVGDVVERELNRWVRKD